MGISRPQNSAGFGLSLLKERRAQGYSDSSGRHAQRFDEDCRKGATEKEIDQNGSHFYVFNGSGVDKRAGTKVKFLVGILAAGDGKAGVVYANYDADCPVSTMDTLEGILKSIKVAGKK
jgi:hypothetical protein